MRLANGIELPREIDLGGRSFVILGNRDLSSSEREILSAAFEVEAVDDGTRFVVRMDHTLAIDPATIERVVIP